MVKTLLDGPTRTDQRWLLSSAPATELHTAAVVPDTFRPVTVDRLDHHVMHTEWYSVSPRRCVPLLRRPSGLLPRRLATAWQ